MEKVSDGVSERFLPPPPVAAIALGNEWPHCPCPSLQTSDDRMARAGLYPPDLLSTHLAQGPGFGTTAAHGGEAVTRKLHTAYKVCLGPCQSHPGLATHHHTVQPLPKQLTVHK